VNDNTLNAMKLKFALFLIAIIFYGELQAVNVVVSAKSDSRMINYGLSKLKETLASQGNSILQKPLEDFKASGIVALIRDDLSSKKIDLKITPRELKPEGFQIIISDKKVIIIGADEKGVMYGLLDIAEQLQNNKGNLGAVIEKTEEPRLGFRGIKFNLPFMAYRSSISLTQQEYVIRDPRFWEAFLDMMAKNRFNVISLWSMHPYHYMIRATNFPEACPFDDKELLAWKNFWTQLFKMAHDRGIETYLINWNLFVSPSFASAHKVAQYSVLPSHAGTGDTSRIIEKYTKETITQVINEYPELDGLGITIGERMGGMTPEERRAWLDRTIFAGMKEANRKIKFVYRAPLSANTGSGGSTSEENDLISRRHVESLAVKEAFVEFKYNWSHGHSSPNLFMVHGGKLTDKYRNPLPEKYKYVWTMRNEDFYILRWGNSDFIREFIKNNGKEYVAGCFIGSEIFTPALDFTSRPGPFKTWDYHFQRQWLWYTMWGRLMFNPETPDAVFEKMLADKYKKPVGKDALAAWKIATNNQLKFASFHMGTADAQLYSEGFCSWGDNTPSNLFNINNIITHPVLDSLRYINIRDWISKGEKVTGNKISPLQLTEELDRDNARLWNLINMLKAANLAVDAETEVSDLTAWYWYGRYFSDKVKAAVALARYRYKGDDQRELAIKYLKDCSGHWTNYTRAVTTFNKESFPFIIAKGDYSWKEMQLQVDKDIDLAKETYPKK
jgi:hypothetical protein